MIKRFLKTITCILKKLCARRNLVVVSLSNVHFRILKLATLQNVKNYRHHIKYLANNYQLSNLTGDSWNASQFTWTSFVKPLVGFADVAKGTWFPDQIRSILALGASKMKFNLNVYSIEVFNYMLILYSLIKNDNGWKIDWKLLSRKSVWKVNYNSNYFIVCINMIWKWYC